MDLVDVKGWGVMDNKSMIRGVFKCSNCGIANTLFSRIGEQKSLIGEFEYE